MPSASSVLAPMASIDPSDRIKSTVFGSGASRYDAVVDMRATSMPVGSLASGDRGVMVPSERSHDDRSVGAEQPIATVAAPRAMALAMHRATPMSSADSFHLRDDPQHHFVGAATDREQ